MGSDWNSCPEQVHDFVYSIVLKIQRILGTNLVGSYLHGSLALGGFHLGQSDIDLICVTANPLTLTDKEAVARILLKASGNPFPIEISFLNFGQLKAWSHPCAFDFHFSEDWRDRFNAGNFEQPANDPDLAAHLTILHHRGITLDGKPIETIFRNVPHEDYLDAILADFDDCLHFIESNPVYSILNMLRVYRYVKDKVVTSKEEAGIWGIATVPPRYRPTIERALSIYQGHSDLETAPFGKNALCQFKTFINNEISNRL